METSQFLGLTLGIESSCDDTSLCVLRGDSQILCLKRVSQADLHAEFGGVVPEIAARGHLEAIFPLLQEVLKESQVLLSDIDLFAATAGPGLIGSLLVGFHMGKTLALMSQKPFVAVHHLEAHFCANYLEQEIVYPAVGLLVSGGHSSLYFLREPGVYELIGESRDDAVGEVYDKVGRELGLGVNAGPVVDRIAGSHSGKCELVLTPPMLHSGNFDFSFSGLKTAALRACQDGFSKEDICYALQKAVVEVLLKKTLKARKDTKAKSVVLAGGVAANSQLRASFLQASLKGQFVLSVPSLRLCTDNGAMVARAGLERYLRYGPDSLSTQAFSRFPLHDYKGSKI